MCVRVFDAQPKPGSSVWIPAKHLNAVSIYGEMTSSFYTTETIFGAYHMKLFAFSVCALENTLSCLSVTGIATLKFRNWKRIRLQTATDSTPGSRSLRWALLTVLASGWPIKCKHGEEAMGSIICDRLDWKRLGNQACHCFTVMLEFESDID